MDRLDELAVLTAIADEGTLVRAASRLRLSPPSVTRALAALEQRAGVRLVERTTRRLSMTPAGHKLAVHGRALLAGYGAALSEAAEDPVAGLVRVTAPMQFGRLHVAPIVADFLATHSRTQVELALHDRNLDMIARNIHVAVRIGDLSDSGLVARRVGEVRRIVVAAPAYLAARGTPLDPADLAGHDTVFGSARSGGRTWQFGPARPGKAVQLTPRLIVEEVAAQLAAVRAGCGIARVLSYQAADDLADGTLVRLLTGFEPPPIPVHLVLPGSGRPAARVRAFVEFAATALRRLAVLRRMDDG